MTRWYIYLEYNKDQNGEDYATRRYYRKKLKKPSDRLKYVGSAELSEDYFIPGSETKYTEVIDLDHVSLVYKAAVRGGRIKEFEETFQGMLERAKDGIMPYISFAGHRVLNKPILKVNGKRHKVRDSLDLTLVY